ncbi:MAG: helix-turn-helix domain-containing protein [Acidimicrobiales bacterium]
MSVGDDKNVGMEREGTSGTKRAEGQVRSRRRELGLSQMDLAGLAGLHVVEVGLVERGERDPAAGTARRLAAALGTDLGAMAGGSAPPPAS